ncbi:hypothetical protein [Ornithinimicrobium sp. Y1694]|uniref:hypothetical protein n=1 Tax=Ornithinimicrobium sp. Y1694 TaxID=3418590 RepID=UPI003CF2F266
MFPSIEDFRAAIWTAAVAAVLGASFLRVTSQVHGDHHGPDLDWIRNDVGRALWEKIPQIAVKYHADPHLVQAVVAAEVMQRPRWLRRIERRWPRTKSFGVAQVSSDRKLTDTESVTLLSQRLADVQVPIEYGTVKRTPTLEWTLEKHNPNPAFISDCLLFLNELKFTYYGEGSEDAGADGLPALILTRVHRAGRNFVLKGSLCSDATRLVLRSSDDGHSISVGVPQLKIRQEWTVQVPITWDSVTIEAVSDRADTGKPLLHVSLLQQYTQYSGPFG